ncbi:30S ribosomal protein S12 methylthiotransferase RimO [bacterium]|nr:30S ribosomal protein S12 methylthiotransferase RimO [bacterium]
MTQPATPPRAALVTLGCPMNQVDSECIMGGLVSRGFEIVPEEEAEVIVVNTCGFIGDAREESIDAILSVAGYKHTGNLRALVVAGCLAERHRDELERELTEADAIVGLADRDRIPALCLELLGRGEQGESVYSRVVTGPPYTAYLKISEGCDNRCSYCTIPLIRGPYRSVPEDDIIRDAEELVSLGTRELILIGQDTTRYGSDLGGKTLPGLLRRLSDIEGADWIRLMYTHPAHFTDELIDAVNGLPKVLPYIDIPVQHISGRVLERMGRRTDPAHIRALLGKIRGRIDGVVLRTSLIVGFPGETGEDFGELLDFVRESRFERLGAFVYSPEEGTGAALMDDRVTEEIAAERYEILMEAQSMVSGQFHESLAGHEFDMIVDSVDPETGAAEGRTYMDAPDVDCTVTVDSGVPEDCVFCRVRITGSGPYDLAGEVVKD